MREFCCWRQYYLGSKDNNNVECYPQYDVYFMKDHLFVYEGLMKFQLNSI